MRASLLVPALCLLCCTPPAHPGVSKLDLIAEMQRALLTAMEAEKSAVLATSDEESAAFAAEARRANAEVERVRVELHRRVTANARPAEMAALERFESDWADLAAVDEKVLALAAANTNHKAAALASGEAAREVNQLVDALAAIEAVATEPAVLRELSGASVAALRSQALLPPHIASAGDTEMTRLEEQMRELAKIIDRALANARKSSTAQPRAAEAWETWARYQHVTAEIVRLSRLNTNVLSADLSLHEQRDALIAAQNALGSLRSAVQDVPRATR